MNGYYVLNRIKKCIKSLICTDAGDAVTKLLIYPKDLTRQVPWNVLHVYNDLVNAQKVMPNEWYANEHGTITLVWEVETLVRWETLGEMEIGQTRWVAFYEEVENQPKFGQGQVGEFYYDWLPNR